MSKSRLNKAVIDEEFIGMLMIISIASRCLIGKQIQMNKTAQSQERGIHMLSNRRNPSL